MTVIINFLGGLVIIGVLLGTLAFMAWAAHGFYHEWRDELRERERSAAQRTRV